MTLWALWEERAWPSFPLLGTGAECPRMCYGGRSRAAKTSEVFVDAAFGRSAAGRARRRVRRRSRQQTSVVCRMQLFLDVECVLALDEAAVPLSKVIASSR